MEEKKGRGDEEEQRFAGLNGFRFHSACSADSDCRYLVRGFVFVFYSSVSFPERCHPVLYCSVFVNRCVNLDHPLPSSHSRMPRNQAGFIILIFRWFVCYLGRSAIGLYFLNLFSSVVRYSNQYRSHFISVLLFFCTGLCLLFLYITEFVLIEEEETIPTFSR